jgi:hypothetical protein
LLLGHCVVAGAGSSDINIFPLLKNVAL